MAAPPVHGQTVLVVDDETSVLGVMAATLKQSGYQVLQATGSSEALKLCKNHQGTIDLLITDLVLPPPGFQFASGENEFPHVHGHELAARALKMRRGLRVVLISGNIEKDLTGYGIRRGALPFLQKPILPAALLDTVMQVLRSPPPTLESFAETAQSSPKDGDEWFD